MRAFGAVVPVLMFAAIVLTANHYIFDAIAGGAVALTGLGLAMAMRHVRAAPPSATAVAIPAFHVAVPARAALELDRCAGRDQRPRADALQHQRQVEQPFVLVPMRVRLQPDR